MKIEQQSENELPPLFIKKQQYFLFCLLIYIYTSYLLCYWQSLLYFITWLWNLCYCSRRRHLKAHDLRWKKYTFARDISWMSLVVCVQNVMWNTYFHVETSSFFSVKRNTSDVLWEKSESLGKQWSSFTSLFYSARRMHVFCSSFKM